MGTPLGTPRTPRPAPSPHPGARDCPGQAAGQGWVRPPRAPSRAPSHPITHPISHPMPHPVPYPMPCPIPYPIPSHAPSCAPSHSMPNPMPHPIPCPIPCPIPSHSILCPIPCPVLCPIPSCAPSRIPRRIPSHAQSHGVPLVPSREQSGAGPPHVTKLQPLPPRGARDLGAACAPWASWRLRPPPSCPRHTRVHTHPKSHVQGAPLPKRVSLGPMGTPVLSPSYPHKALQPGGEHPGSPPALQALHSPKTPGKFPNPGTFWAPGGKEKGVGNRGDGHLNGDRWLCPRMSPWCHQGLGGHGADPQPHELSPWQGDLAVGTGILAAAWAGS